MPKLINRYGVVDAINGTDGWIERSQKDTEPSNRDSIPVGAKLLLPLAEFLANGDAWRQHVGPHGALGVRLAPTDDPANIASELEKLALIAIDFPVFTDGRGYSIAALLRERYGYIGELRALGDIQRDQLYLLSRSGFTTFALRDDQSVEKALAAFHDFSRHYQRGYTPATTSTPTASTNPLALTT